MSYSEPDASRELLGETEEWEEAFRLTRRSLRRRRRQLSFFDWPKDEVFAVDLGSSDGLDLGVLKEFYAHNIVALDISPRLLAQVPGRRVVGDAHRLPFPSDSLDLVIANSALHHLDPERIVSEIGRVLKPGGRLHFLEPRPCLGRRFLDWSTMYAPLNRVLPFLRARHLTLVEEMTMYTQWIEEFPRLIGRLKEHGFALDKQRYTLIGILGQWRKN